MSKNDKNRHHRPGNGPHNRPFQMLDQTAERQFALKIAQARKLFNQQKFADALLILEPMNNNFVFSSRGEFLDLLGACYASAGFLYEAREVFTRALSAPPKHKYRDSLNKYNLVKLCAMTGSPFIAYEYSQQLDCEAVAEAAHRPDEAIRCRTLVAAIREGVAMQAKEANMSFDEYVKFSLLLDKGKLEMDGPELDLDEAILTFRQASRLDPNSTTPYNNLIIIYLRQGKLEQAVELARELLEKLDPNNVHGLSNIVRLLCSLDRREEARAYLDRLLAQSIEPSDDLVKVAEALIYFNQDQAIYDRLQPLTRNEDLFRTLRIVDRASAEQTLLFEIAAAANAGNRARALELAWACLGKFEIHQVLLDRTYEALKNEEGGPLPGERFFYWEPKALHPQVAQAYEEVGPLLLKLPPDESEKAVRYEKSLRPFFVRYGQAALDYVAWLYWTNRGPEVLKAVLTQTLECGAEGTVELVKRLAFGRVGDVQQRQVAQKALVQAGLSGEAG